MILSSSDGLKPDSKVRIEFDIWSEDDMRAVRDLTDRAVEDTVAAVERRVGLIRGAEDLDPAWVRMIARHGARHALQVEINPDR